VEWLIQECVEFVAQSSQDFEATCLLRPQESKNPHIMKSLLLPSLLFAMSLPVVASPAGQIDLSKFPAASVDDVVVPVPSEVFIVLDKLGNPNWGAELPKGEPQKTANRAQVALLLGTVIADGFIAVEAEDSEKVKEIGQQVLSLADAINVRKAVLSRSKSITEKAEAREWGAVRKEFDGALQDVKGAMEELGDQDLAQLVSLGGWVRGTEVLTSVVSKNYSQDGAELLNQPKLLEYFTVKLDNLSNDRLKSDPLVKRVRRLLTDLKPSIDSASTAPLSPERVIKINELTGETVIAINPADRS